MAVWLPSVVVLHLPGGEDLLLRNRVAAASGGYSLKLGSHQFKTGSGSVTLSNYDGFVGQTVDGISLERLQASTVTVGIGTHSLFYGRVRDAQEVQRQRRTDVRLTLRDTMAELAAGQQVTVPPRRAGERLWEKTGERVNAILDAYGWPGGSSWRQVDEGVYLCPPQNPDAQGLPQAVTGRLIDLLRQAATTEWARLGVAHGRALQGREWNRGRLVFDSRDVVPPGEWIHIDNYSESLQPGSIRSASPLRLEPDKRDLINIVRLTSASAAAGVEGETLDGTVDPEWRNHDSIVRYGAQEYAPDGALLSDPEGTRQLARWLLSVFAEPRLTYRGVVLKPYLTDDEELCRRVYQLSIDKTVRVTGVQAGSDEPETTLHRVDGVKWKLMPGDNNAVDADGNFAGGAIVDLTIDLQIPEASAFWQYGLRGASELGETTLFAGDQPGDDQTDYFSVPPRSDFRNGQTMSNRFWNTNMINKLTTVYESEDDRRNRRAQTPGIGGNRPNDGQVTVLGNRLWLSAYNAATGSDQVLAQVESRDAPSRWRPYDETTGSPSSASRLDYGNWMPVDDDYEGAVSG